MCVCAYGRHDNEEKESLAHENHSDNSLLSFGESYRAGLSKHNPTVQQSYVPLNCRTDSFTGVFSLFITDVYNTRSYSEKYMITMFLVTDRVISKQYITLTVKTISKGIQN